MKEKWGIEALDPQTYERIKGEVFEWAADMGFDKIWGAELEEERRAKEEERRAKEEERRAKERAIEENKQLRDRIRLLELGAN